MVDLSGHPGASEYPSYVRRIVAPKLVARTDSPVELEQSVLDWLEQFLRRLEKADGRLVRSGEYDLILPGFAPGAAVVLAYLHGLGGHFPHIRWYLQLPAGGWALSPSFSLQRVRLVARNSSR